MSSAQRLVLIATLLLAATVCHFSFCSWSFGSEPYPRPDIVVGWSIDRGNRHFTGLRLYATYGIVAAQGEWRLAVVAGVIPPMLAIGLATYLALGWRSVARRQRGACPRCGYQLNFDYTSNCPECGWRGDH